MTSLTAANELMLSHVWRYLPTPLHNAYVCSSGTKGYSALKETLQNGIPGHTLLIESKDLRDVGENDSAEGPCCLVYIPNMEEHKYTEQIPPTVTHVTVYGNVTSMPVYFLSRCTGLASVDLSRLSQIAEVRELFLEGCTGLTSVDLSPLSQVTDIPTGFLANCAGLTIVDLSPLLRVKLVRETFLAGCSRLTSVDLSPLSQVTEVGAGFLWGCTGLTSVDLSPLSQVRVVDGRFLEGCPRITSIDKLPLLCAEPPSGWLLKNGKWIR